MPSDRDRPDPVAARGFDRSKGMEQRQFDREESGLGGADGRETRIFRRRGGSGLLEEESDGIRLIDAVVADAAAQLVASPQGDKQTKTGDGRDFRRQRSDRGQSSRRALDEGGYEGGESHVYYGLPSLWAPTIEEDIVKAVHETGK
jgi:hypothetical protein